MKPWHGVIPAEDLKSFPRLAAMEGRELAAGLRPCLIVVDMVVSSVDDAFPAGCSRTGLPAVQANEVLLQTARTKDIPVFFTKDWPEVQRALNPAERGLWKGRALRREAVDLRGDQIVKSLAPRAEETVIHKGSMPSGFFGTPLASYLTYYGIDTTIITGMLTSVCVRATAVDAFQHNYHVVIPYECVADRCQISHQVTLFDLHMKHADVVSLRETVDYLEGLASGYGQLLPQR